MTQRPVWQTLLGHFFVDNVSGWGVGLGDPHKLHGESVNPEHRDVVGGRFVGQNRLWFLTFKSCTAGARIMSISGVGGWLGGWASRGRFVGQNRLWFLPFKSWTAGQRIMSISGVGGWLGGWAAGWVGGQNPHSARGLGWGGVGWGGVGWGGVVGGGVGWGWVGWGGGGGGGGAGCRGLGWAVWLCGWLGGLLGGWLACARIFSELNPFLVQNFWA